MHGRGQQPPRPLMSGGKIFPMMQVRIEFIVPLDHQPKLNPGFASKLAPTPAQFRDRRPDRSRPRKCRHRTTTVRISRHCSTHRRPGRCSVEKRRSRRIGHLRQFCRVGPLPQSCRPAGVGQAGLQKQPGQFLSRSCECGRRNQRGEEQQQSQVLTGPQRHVSREMAWSSPAMTGAE